jgi:hypothetical protein
VHLGSTDPLLGAYELFLQYNRIVNKPRQSEGGQSGGGEEIENENIESKKGLAASMIYLESVYS